MIKLKKELRLYARVRSTMVMKLKSRDTRQRKNMILVKFTERSWNLRNKLTIITKEILKRTNSWCQAKNNLERRTLVQKRKSTNILKANMNARQLMKA